MRKIQIEFEVPEEFEDDYKDTCADLVFEDFFKPHGVQKIGVRVLNDSQHSIQADADAWPCKDCGGVGTHDNGCPTQCN